MRKLGGLAPIAHGPSSIAIPNRLGRSISTMCADNDNRGLWRFFYVSRLCASPLLIDDLLAVSRRNNRACSITGLLVFSGGHFAQFVEGPKSSLDHLLQALRRDTRHDRFTLQCYDTTSERRFHDWAMGCMSSPSMDEVLMHACGRSLSPQEAADLSQRLFFDPRSRVLIQ